MPPHIKVEPKVHAALMHLQDVEVPHLRDQLDALTVRVAAVKENYDGCLAVNREQATRLGRAEHELAHLRKLREQYEKEIQDLKVRVIELEPLRSDVKQPAIGGAR